VLKIRLKRAGGRNHPFYRVVVIDSRKARDSRALEEIGYYNPLESPHVVNIDRERVAHWAERGAQVTDAVRGLLREENTTHPTRRMAEHFEPEAPPVKAKPKAKEEAGGVATAEAPAAPAKKAAKKTKKAAAKTAAPAEGGEGAPPAEASPESEPAASKGSDGAEEKE